jgi:hypothetical protein
MKKLFPGSSSLRSFAYPRRGKWATLSLLLLTGCMATQNRWQATQMRQQVMDYYNDQIMENLIRTKEKLPFVHVDVTSLTTTDVASLTGTIGSGETPSFSRTSPSSAMVGALHTITRGVTRPFSYSVSPNRNTSLQIVSSPVLGQLPADKQTTSKTTTKTETTEPAETVKDKKSVKTTTTEEETQNSKPKTVYDLYEEFVESYDQDSADVADKDKGFCHTEGLQPPPEKYIPGTKKRWGTRYYYIKDTIDHHFREAYYDFCRELFTKGQTASVQAAIQAQANAAVEAAGKR